MSPLTWTVTVFVTSPAAKLTVPPGRLPPKSAASAGLAPLPATAQATLPLPAVPPPRVTVKVKAVVPLLPSGLSALVAAMA